MNKANMWEADYRKADKELTKLKADVVRLRKALEPFAKRSNEIGVGLLNCQIATNLLHNAARALEETK